MDKTPARGMTTMNVGDGTLHRKCRSLAISGHEGLSRGDWQAVAGAACIGIFNLFDEQSIAGQPRAIQKAWETGRALSLLS